LPYVHTETTAETLNDRIRRIVEEVLGGGNLFLVDLAMRGHKGSRVIGDDRRGPERKS
jgi:hypothetical protein